MTYYIYKIENLVNHKVYIGLTNNIERRKNRHFSDLRTGRHDNQFLQKEFNIYQEENFSFEVLFEGQVSEEEIGLKEQEYIKKYDSYRNGYNQNEGGNFGASNGGSQLTQKDIFNILAALEFVSRPGQILSEIYGVSKTTISRIKKGENHIQYKEEYEALPLEERRKIYDDFCQLTNFYERKVNTTILKSKRKLTEQQVYMILANYDYHITTKKRLMQLVNVNSGNTLDSIRDGISYKDYSYKYNNMTEEEKQNIVSQLRNELM